MNPNNCIQSHIAFENENKFKLNNQLLIKYFNNNKIKKFYHKYSKFASRFLNRAFLSKNRSIIADVAKLVDALDLGSSAERRVGSSPSIRTLIFKKTELVK
jgi:hypothetical protein